MSTVSNRPALILPYPGASARQGAVTSASLLHYLVIARHLDKRSRDLRGLETHVVQQEMLVGQQPVGRQLVATQVLSTALGEPLYTKNASAHRRVPHDREELCPGRSAVRARGLRSPAPPASP